LLSFQVWAQQELNPISSAGRPGLSVTSCTDYQAQGINPANLGIEPSYDGMHQTMGFTELGFSAFSNGMGKFNLKSSLLDGERVLSGQDKNQAAIDLSGKRITANLDFLFAGYAWQRVSGGSGFSFTIREKVQWFSSFNPSLASILFNGSKDKTYFDGPILSQRLDSTNGQIITDTLGAMAKEGRPLAEVFKDSKVAMSWNREFAFAYGVNVINGLEWKINLGVGIKYVEGIGYVDIQSDGNNFKAFVASSPYFDLKYGNNGGLTRAKDSVNGGVWPNAVGHGIGFEVGTTIIYKDRIRISVALSDLGSVVYNTNVYVAPNTILTEIRNTGFTHYDFYNDTRQMDGAQKDILEWQGTSKKSKPLPTKLRFGIAYTKEKWQIGLETILPMNSSAGNFQKPLVSIGGEVLLLEWLKVGTGIVYGGNVDQILVPFGLNFITSGGLWEMGIGFRDVISYTRDTSPMLSLCTGVMRFRF